MTDDQKNKIHTPLDPTNDAGTMMGDTSGLTGISEDNTRNDDLSEDTTPISHTMSDVMYKTSLATADGTDDDAPELPDNEDPPSATPASTPTGNEELDIASPDEVGEQSVSGDMPDPASDDDTLENAHNVGLRLNEDEEHPQELDIASDIDKAEEFHRTH